MNMNDKTASEQIDHIIEVTGGWKAELLARLRSVIRDSDSSLQEEIKWKMATRPDGLPVWSHNGIVCFAEIWKDNIKLIFPHGAQLQDPQKLLNSRLESKDIRAIEFKEGSVVKEAELSSLVAEAITFNESKVK